MVIGCPLRKWRKSLRDWRNADRRYPSRQFQTSACSCLREYSTRNRHASLLSRHPTSLRHHHVESVHLSATGGSLLDPALAVVQTPAREYYILRDNGMEVGCEEDGVARVWMRILGCNTRGEPVERAGVSFEELKAYIQDL